MVLYIVDTVMLIVVNKPSMLSVGGPFCYSRKLRAQNVYEMGTWWTLVRGSIKL